METQIKESKLLERRFDAVKLDLKAGFEHSKEVDSVFKRGDYIFYLDPENLEFLRLLFKCQNGGELSLLNIAELVRKNTFDYTFNKLAGGFQY